MVSKTRTNKNNAQKAQKYVTKRFADSLGLIAGAPLAAPHTCDLQPRTMGLPGADVMKHSMAAQFMVPYNVEVKFTSRKSVTIFEWYEQSAKTADQEAEMPLVCIYPKRAVGQKKHRVLAVIDLEHLLMLNSEFVKLPRN